MTGEGAGPGEDRGGRRRVRWRREAPRPARSPRRRPRCAFSAITVPHLPTSLPADDPDSPLAEIRPVGSPPSPPPLTPGPAHGLPLCANERGVRTPGGGQSPPALRGPCPPPPSVLWSFPSPLHPWGSLCPRPSLSKRTAWPTALCRRGPRHWSHTLISTLLRSTLKPRVITPSGRVSACVSTDLVTGPAPLTPSCPPLYA